MEVMKFLLNPIFDIYCFPLALITSIVKFIREVLTQVIMLYKTLSFWHVMWRIMTNLVEEIVWSLFVTLQTLPSAEPRSTQVLYTVLWQNSSIRDHNFNHLNLPANDLV